MRVDLVGRHAGDDIFGDVVELFHIEQRAGNAHLLCVKRKLIERRFGIGQPPILEIGVEERQQVFLDRRHTIPLPLVEIERQLRVLAFGELAFIAVVQLHKLRRMDIFRHPPSHRCKKLNMDGQRGEPFLAAHHMRRAHEMVVDDMRKMVCRNAVRFEQHDILVVFRQLHRPLHKIRELDAPRGIALAAKTQHKRLARRELPADLIKRHIAVNGPFAVVAEIFLVFRLLLADRRKLVLRAEAWICLTLLDKPFGIRLIDLCALPLSVRPVKAVVPIDGCSLVKRQLIIGKDLQNRLNRAGHLALLVGILDAQIEHAAALVGETLVRDRTEQVAQMHKAGRAGRHARHLCALGQHARRIARLNIGGRRVDAGEQQIGKCGIIHDSDSFYVDFTIVHNMLQRRPPYKDSLSACLPQSGR